MVRVIVRLGVLLALVAAGVHFFYARMEKELLADVNVSASSQGVISVDVDKQESKKAIKEQSRSMDSQVIVTRNIFQTKLEPEAKPVEKVVKKVVPTSLDLTLLGTVTGDDQTARAIIIDKKTRKQDIYQIGDAVQGAFIGSIDRGKITLEVDGRNEVLTIKEREGGGPGAPQGDNLSAAQDTQMNRSAPAPRKPRLRRNRRVTRPVVQKHEAAEPDIMPDEFPDEIDEPAIIPEEIVDEPTV